MDVINTDTKHNVYIIIVVFLNILRNRLDRFDVIIDIPDNIVTNIVNIHIITRNSFFVLYQICCLNIF